MLYNNGLSKNIRCHVWPSLSDTCKSPDQTQAKWAVRLVIAHALEATTWDSWYSLLRCHGYSIIEVDAFTSQCCRNLTQVLLTATNIAQTTRAYQTSIVSLKQRTQQCDIARIQPKSQQNLIHTEHVAGVDRVSDLRSKGLGFSSQCMSCMSGKICILHCLRAFNPNVYLLHISNLQLDQQLQAAIGS